jgi:hypothetical protein
VRSSQVEANGVAGGFQLGKFRFSRPVQKTTSARIKVKQYRGSSDIKASIDMGYLVSGETRYGKLHRLRMEPFKSRIAPGQRFAMEFREGRGFVGTAGPAQPVVIADPSQFVSGIVAENPQINGTRVKELARPFGISRNAVDQILQSGNFLIEPGRGNERGTRQEMVLFPNLPDPRVWKTGKLEISDKQSILGRSGEGGN